MGRDSARLRTLFDDESPIHSHHEAISDTILNMSMCQHWVWRYGLRNRPTGKVIRRIMLVMDIAAHSTKFGSIDKKIDYHSPRITV